jgi:hypothetical protein
VIARASVPFARPAIKLAQLSYNILTIELSNSHGTNG